MTAAVESNGAAVSTVTFEPEETVETFPLASVSVATRDLTPSDPSEDKDTATVLIVFEPLIEVDVTVPVPSSVPEVELRYTFTKSPTTGAVPPLVGALNATFTVGVVMFVILSLVTPELEAVASVMAPGAAGGVVSVEISVRVWAAKLATLFPAISCKALLAPDGAA